jgi:hypothetical protein
MMMNPRTVRYINLSIFTLILGIFFATSGSWMHQEPIRLAEPSAQIAAELPFSFQAKEAEKTAFGPPFLILEEKTLPLRLPDLRATLIYFGSHYRPDVSDSGSLVNIGIRGVQNSIPVPVKSPIYLVYESKQSGHQASNMRWSFSPNNSPTTIWIEVSPLENTAEVSLFLKGENDEIIRTPSEFSRFTLPQMHVPTVVRSNNTWEIGGIRVDSSLLVRQRALWLGQDLFLQEFGGDEYSDIAFKERIDFTTPEAVYSLYVGEGDCIAWFDDRWNLVEPGVESRKKPLLVVKKIGERSISFDLWDEEGKNKIPIELHKSMIPTNFNANIDIKLIGARSKKDWIVSVAGTRITLTENDWLLGNAGIWKKILTTEELDSYVNGTTKGALIVLSGTEKEGNNVSLVGTLFDESRTRKAPLKISLFKSWEATPKDASAKKGSKTKESDDDEEDDDEELDYDDEDDEEDDEDDEDEVI